MAASTLEGVLTDMVTVLAVAHAETDLSGDDQVQLGAFTKPPIVPFVSINFPDIQSSDTDVPMGQFRREHVVEIIGWSQSADDSMASRFSSLTRLVDDVLSALEEDAWGNTGLLFARGVRRFTIHVTGTYGLAMVQSSQPPRFTAEVNLELAFKRGI